MGAVHIVALVEDGGLVGLGVAVGVFEDEDAVALGAFAEVLAVVHDFADPDTATMVDVDAGRARHHRFAGKELHQQFGIYREGIDSICRIVRTAVAGGDGAGILCVYSELHTGAALLGAAFI